MRGRMQACAGMEGPGREQCVVLMSQVSQLSAFVTGRLALGAGRHLPVPSPVRAAQYFDISWNS